MKRAARIAMNLALGTALVLGTTSAFASVKLEGAWPEADKPISIDAASLEVRDRDKAATFKGDVKVVQGDTTMRCKVLVVFYEGGGSSTGASASVTPAPGASKSKRTPRRMCRRASARSCCGVPPRLASPSDRNTTREGRLV